MLCDESSFDLIYTVDVIHHLADRPAYFTGALRALVQGGLICTVTDSKSDIPRRRPLSNYFPETVEVELTRYPRMEVIRGEMAEAGFRQIEETHVELEYELTDIQPYRDRAFSSLHLIDQNAFAQGIDRLEFDLQQGPIAALSLYTLIWGGSDRA